MHLEKNRLDQIQNGHFSAIIHFHLADICQTVLNGKTITIKQNVIFRGMMHPWNLIQNGQQSALFTSRGLISGKLC